MLTSWRHLSAIFVISILTITSGIINGYLDGRWSNKAEASSAQGMLLCVAKQAGPWVQVGERELGKDAKVLLKCDSYLLREYWNGNTGNRVTVAVMYGPRGPIAVHKPEICYSSAGAVTQGPRQLNTIQTEQETSTFWNVRINKNSDQNADLDVWYAWSDGGPWLASEYPRFWMTEKLYKIQLATYLGSTGPDSPAKDFLSHFVPEVRRTMTALNAR